MCPFYSFSQDFSSIYYIIEPGYITYPGHFSIRMVHRNFCENKL